MKHVTQVRLMDASRPGEFPFTRGIHPLMYAERPWTFRQYSGYATAGETNRRYRLLLERGQTGLAPDFGAAGLPVQPARDHQMEHREQAALEADHNPFTETAEILDPPSWQARQGRLDGPQQEGAVEADRFQRLALDKKVRFLPYETIDEIDSFFADSSTGLTVDLIVGRSELVT